VDPLIQPTPLDPPVTHEGIHATTVARLESIRSTGFVTGPLAARRGPGVYFWQKNPYWEKIGRSWHKSAKNKFKAYVGDPDQRCGIIHALLVSPRSRYFDFEADEFKKALFRLAYAKRLTKRIEQEDISDLWTIFIESIEKKSGTSIAFFRVALELPEPGDWFPFRALGNPIAYVVRDPTIISITEYGTYDEDFDG
jgi:hypothetical protein